MARVSVGGDQVRCLDRVLCAARPILEHGIDTVSVLFEQRELGRESHLGAEPPSSVEQQELELVLVDGAKRRWAGAHERAALGDLLDRRVVLAGEGFGAHWSPRGPSAIRERGRLDGRLQTDLAEQLNRAWQHGTQARMDEKVRVAFDDDAWHAVPRQEHGARQPRESTADNQDRSPLVRHDLSFPSAPHNRGTASGRLLFAGLAIMTDGRGA